MSLIAMAVWDTEENRRSAMTQKTLESLWRTVDFSKHRLVVIDNGSCEETRSILKEWRISFAGRYRFGVFTVIANEENKGTAVAINQGWMLKENNEPVVKMDNDIVVHQKGWIDLLEEVLNRDHTIGIVGLKRKDCFETPWNTTQWFRSTLRMLPHTAGERWLIVEDVFHVMGSCQMYNPALLEKIGYLYQMGGLYGFDDALASVRAHVAGFKTCFLSSIEIDHIDEGGTDYTKWKQEYSGGFMKKYQDTRAAYESGRLPVYHGPSDK